VDAIVRVGSIPIGRFGSDKPTLVQQPEGDRIAMAVEGHGHLQCPAESPTALEGLTGLPVQREGALFSALSVHMNCSGWTALADSWGHLKIGESNRGHFREP